MFPASQTCFTLHRMWEGLGIGVSPALCSYSLCCTALGREKEKQKLRDRLLSDHGNSLRCSLTELKTWLAGYRISCGIKSIFSLLLFRQPLNQSVQFHSHQFLKHCPFCGSSVLSISQLNPVSRSAMTQHDFSSSRHGLESKVHTNTRILLIFIQLW